MTTAVTNVLMPGRSRVTAPVDRVDLWLWNLPHFRVNVGVSPTPTQFFDRQVIVPGLRIVAPKFNTVDVLIGKANVAANGFMDILAPGDSISIEPDEDTEAFTGTIGDATGQAVIALGHPIELIDASQLWAVPASGGLTAVLMVTLYLRGGTP